MRKARPPTSQTPSHTPACAGGGASGAGAKRTGGAEETSGAMVAGGSAVTRTMGADSTGIFVGATATTPPGSAPPSFARAWHRRLARYLTWAARCTSRPCSVVLYFLAARHSDRRRASSVHSGEQYQWSRSQPRHKEKTFLQLGQTLVIPRTISLTAAALHAMRWTNARRRRRTTLIGLLYGGPGGGDAQTTRGRECNLPAPHRGAYYLRARLSALSPPTPAPLRG